MRAVSSNSQHVRKRFMLLDKGIPLRLACIIIHTKSIACANDIFNVEYILNMS